MDEELVFGRGGWKEVWMDGGRVGWMKGGWRGWWMEGVEGRGGDWMHWFGSVRSGAWDIV